MNGQRKDYYKILGVSKDATADEIKKVFRRKAKEHHPDKHAGSKRDEERFKELSEAYDTLSDPEKRRQYDEMGEAWKAAQAQGYSGSWENLFGGAGGAGGFRHAGGGGQAHDFGDFMNILRGFGMHPGAAEAHAPEASHLESEIAITLEEAFSGCQKKVNLTLNSGGGLRRHRTEHKTLDIRIPRGIRDGQKIRLRADDGKMGTEDIYIRVRILPHPVFSFEEDGNLVSELRVSPWEAALGERVSVPTLEGKVELKIPAGIRSGQKVRLRGSGFPGKGKEPRGDLLYRISIVVPKELTPAERTLFEQLRENSRFNPRA